MSTWGKIKAVVTLGASTKLEERAREHELVRQERANSERRLVAAQSRLTPHMALLGRTKQSAFHSLNAVRDLMHLQLGKDNEGQFAADLAVHSTVKQLDVMVHEYTAALAAAGGLCSGTLAAAGAWGLVSTFGTASTGTAISTLTGAALSHAGLAWFGGGAIAAGGGGMALGSMVIGGIVLAPVAVVGVWKLNSSIRNQISIIDKEIVAMRKDIIRFENSARIYIAIVPRIRNIEIAVYEAHVKFLELWNDFRREVFPIPFLSYLIRVTRARLGTPFFNRSECERLEIIEAGCKVLMSAMKQKVFTAEGVVCTDPLLLLFDNDAEKKIEYEFRIQRPKHWGFGNRLSLGSVYSSRPVDLHHSGAASFKGTGFWSGFLFVALIVGWFFYVLIGRH